MTKVEEIKAAIESLPEEEFFKLRQWFSEMDWQEWDEQIVRDSQTGKSDFLIKEAFDEKNKGKLKDL